MLHGNRSVVALLLLGCLGVSACSQSEAGSVQSEPAKVEKIKGSSLTKVVLSKKAAQRIGIRTAVVRAGRTIPYAAVLYGADGKAFTYTNPSRLVYVRHAIRLTHVNGSTARLQRGLTPGTAVVIVGAAELLGAEYGVEE